MVWVLLVAVVLLLLLLEGVPERMVAVYGVRVNAHHHRRRYSLCGYHSQQSWASCIYAALEFLIKCFSTILVCFDEYVLTTSAFNKAKLGFIETFEQVLYSYNLSFIKI